MRTRNAGGGGGPGIGWNGAAEADRGGEADWIRVVIGVTELIGGAPFVAKFLTEAVVVEAAVAAVAASTGASTPAERGADSN